MSRVENLEELISATRQFRPREEEENLSLLDAFLAHVALETGEGQAACKCGLCASDDITFRKRSGISIRIYGGIRRRVIPA